jgi:predicted ArsR family transcriptional regulator
MYHERVLAMKRPTQMLEPANPGSLDDRVSAIATLQEPVRRSLYLHVAAQAGEVSRDEAAAAVGIQRALAAFHLDKLVEAGLLEASYRRLSGRSGPGAGRPAKLYRRSSAEHAVSFPPRHYDWAAELRAEAVEEADERPARSSLKKVARRFGQQLGEAARRGLSARASRARRLAALSEALGRYGYEPRQEGRSVRLSNCPFHALSERLRELVCGMNLSLLQAAVDAMGGGDLEARPDPRPGECCVTLAARAKNA